jgi:Putative bacterial sensory transduction regulator
MVRVITITILLAMQPFAANAENAAPTVSLKTVESFQNTLRGMGYDPKLARQNGYPVVEITSGGSVSALVLGGCENDSNCGYVAFGTTITDVVKPPSAWLQKVNEEYDFMKVALNDDKTLRISYSAIVEGMPLTSFRRVLDQWLAGKAEIARKAIDDQPTLISPGKPR